MINEFITSEGEIFTKKIDFITVEAIRLDNECGRTGLAPVINLIDIENSIRIKYPDATPKDEQMFRSGWISACRSLFQEDQKRQS